MAQTIVSTARAAYAAARQRATEPAPFLTYLGRGLARSARGAIIVAGFFVGFTFLGDHMATPQPDAPSTPAPAVAAPTSAGKLAAAVVERLVERHGCWTGEAPPEWQGEIPGHAVVTLPGRAPRRTPSSVGFDVWLGPDGQLATGDERPGTVHAFCP